MRNKKPVVPSVVDSPVVETLAVPIPVAAQMLGGTVRAVRSLLWAKKLPYIRLGKKFVIPVDALRAFVRRGAV